MTTEAGYVGQVQMRIIYQCWDSDSPHSIDGHPCNENFKLDEFFNGFELLKKSLMGNISERTQLLRQ